MCVFNVWLWTLSKSKLHVHFRARTVSLKFNISWKLQLNRLVSFWTRLSGTLGRRPPTCSVTVLHSERGVGTAQIRTACAQNRVSQVVTAISQCIQARGIGHPLFWNVLGLVVNSSEVQRLFGHRITDGTPRTYFNRYEPWVIKQYQKSDW